MNRTIVDTQIGCEFGKVAAQRVVDIKTAHGTVIGLEGDGVPLTITEMASEMDRAVRIEKYLGNCSLCHGKPEDAPGNMVCPLAMEVFDQNLEEIANGVSSKWLAER